MFEPIFNIASDNTAFTPLNLILALGTALAMGLLISIVYMKTHKTASPTQSFALALVIMPAIVTVIILLIGNSVARAFSLAGAFQIIRFRSTPGDSKDITYVLLSMSIGLSCGMGYLIYGVIVAIILCVVIVALSLLKFGQLKQDRRLLKIIVPEDLNCNGAFEDILTRYTVSHQKIKIRTTDLGSLYELQYLLTVPGELDEKAMIDELRCRNGNLNITLLLAPQQNNEEF